MIKKGKSIDSLMRHIRNDHNISIQGSKDKKQLINIGYYHGYKGYRFYQSIHDPIAGIDSFNQIMAIAKFDQSVKTNFYPLVMQFENIVKNVIVNQVVTNIEPSFDNIYRNKLVYYKLIPRRQSRDYHNAVNKRLKLKKIIDSTIAHEYSNNNKLIAHYINNSHPIPLWAIFETISLGNIGQFMWTLNIEDRIDIARFFNVKDTQYDPKAEFMRQAIYIIRDLRNAVAHNHIIFDCRFKNSHTRISRNVKETIRNKININNSIDFNKLFDYLALLLIILKESGTPIGDLKKYIFSFEQSINLLYNSTQNSKINLPYSLYNKIIGEDYYNKLSKLKQYIIS